jgi:CRISPR-associated endonuclease/helicase Cas3
LPNDYWKDLSLPINGHHSGLVAGGEADLNLREYSKSNCELLSLCLEYSKQLQPPSSLNRIALSEHERELLIRMIFSALVDADYLDTEAHFDGQLSNARRGAYNITELWNCFDENQRKLMSASASRSGVNPIVTNARREIYEACLAAAETEPGLFRLTVPTGGGKTRSSLAFALRHILAHFSRLRRIIVVIPYTSIIDQTAREYRRILGHNAVLEHHSQMPIIDEEEQTQEQVRLRLASENWDSPIIVTTTVQFFESLFSNKPAKVRKLHNIAGSVIILDEVQGLPVGVLSPILDVLQTLVKYYGVSVVLSSATQPAFHEVSSLKARDIVPNEQFEKHFVDLARVNYARRPEKLTWEELARELLRRRQALVVLNSRKDALQLLDVMHEIEYVFHLSTLLCGRHRKAILRLVQRRLKKGLPVLLVSTQVIEAGVDIDFPEVWRAIGPLDRIVQAAGRCNREGRMPERGTVVIFEPADGRMPKGEYKAGFGWAEYLLGQHEPDELHNPKLHEEFFRRLYSEQNCDVRDVQVHRKHLNFPETAKRFRIIADDTVLAAVGYGRGMRLLREYEERPSRAAWRRLQPYVVSLPRREAQRLRDEGWLEPVSEGFYRWCGKYDRIRGLCEAVYDPADLVG